MSFGGGGGFGGFGSNNNQQSSGFGSGGGFGANTNTGFGSNTNTSTPFGQSGTGGGLFGNSNTSSPFGGGGGGFGTNTTTSFGSKPFGSSTTGGGLFGSGGGGTSTSGSTFGGFGSTTANNPTSTGFGNTGGSLFGQNKTGFGSTTGTGTGTGTTPLFGGGSSGGGFGGGFGATNQIQQNQPNNGTANTPFTAFQEKDGTATGGTQHYQTITFQDPYKNYSLEELRLVDYNQGRRYGNQNGQAGAFGQSTGFGGFSTNNATGTNTNTGGGLFSNNANTSSPFGQSNTTTAFGSNTATTGGGLFGSNKPAGGLFGASSTSQPNTGSNLFGGSSNTNTAGGGFGSSGTGFGSSTFGGQTQTQNKPAFGGFGSGTAGNTTSAFGGGNTAGGGLFGGQQNQTPANQTSTTGGNIFSGGQTQAQPQQSGGLFSGFGGQPTQQKPGLFGGSTTGTTGSSLFGGQNNQPQQSGGLFGNTSNQGTGIFGSKPAGNTGGLFSGSTQNTATQQQPSLFNTNSNNQQGSSLFTNQQKPSLFGTSTNTGGGLFGGQGQSNNATPMGGSLFSSQNQQAQPQQPSMNNSLFAASGGSSLLQTSMSTNPYGNDALFAGLATPTQSPGPLATPLSSSQKTRKSAILPQHKLNPSASTRLLTPQNKRQGYGFTYSTYGTPNSASSNFSGSLFGSGSLTKSLGKSLSTSNLRNTYTPETSILAPGAFSTNGRSFATGSLKKLNINRSINTRVPLFDEPSPDKKRVSFAGPTDGVQNGVKDGPDANGVTGGELVLRADEAPPGEGASSSSTVNGDAANGNDRPEMTQVNGNELTPVSENGALAPHTSSSFHKKGDTIVDPQPGQYWSTPSLDELKKMSRSQLSQVQNFVVGRDQIGKIEFNPGKTVDLTGVDLDKLFGDIVQLTVRAAIVYSENTTVPKPPRGQGLNQFSRITLSNSYPRNKVGRRDQKHLERLKRVTGTTFEQYRSATGEWVFTVQHFSTYRLDYDDDEEYSEDEDEESSELSAPPDTPAQLGSSQMTGTPQEDSPTSPTQSSPDDTFDFKKGKRSRASVPGGYGDDVAYEEDADETMDTAGDSFLGQRSVGSLDGQQDADYTEESESESVEDQDMADAVSGPVRTTEQQAAKESDALKASLMPKSILKNSQLLLPPNGTPMKDKLVFDDDWANQLQRTISPKKQPRQALRESQADVLRERDANITSVGQSINGQPVFSRMEMMESLFGDTGKGKGSMAKRAGHGIEV